MKELDIPPEVLGETGAIEMIRFWISDGRDHVMLNIGLFDEEEEPRLWGAIAADIARHAVRGMRQDDPSRDEQTLLAQIEAGFVDRLKQTVDYDGQLAGRRQ